MNDLKNIPRKLNRNAQIPLDLAEVASFSQTLYLQLILGNSTPPILSKKSMPMVGVGASKRVSFSSKISCAKLGYKQNGRAKPIMSSFPLPMLLPSL